MTFSYRGGGTHSSINIHVKYSNCLLYHYMVHSPPPPPPPPPPCTYMYITYIYVGGAVLACLAVCTTLLASFFLPPASDYKHMIYSGDYSDITTLL